MAGSNKMYCLRTSPLRQLDVVVDVLVDVGLGDELDHAHALGRKPRLDDLVRS